MPKFTITDQVDALSFDFTPYAGSGSIPEPSSEQIESFRRSLAELIAENSTATGDGLTLIQQVQAYLAVDAGQVNEKMLHLTAEVCSDSPSFDDLMALPFRPQQAFLGWIIGVFVRPEV